MPSTKENNPPGDLIIRFHIYYPKELNEDQKASLKDILQNTDMSL